MLAGGVLTRPEIARRLAAVFPGVDARELALVVHLRLALLHPPPAGLWGHRGRVGCVPAESWLGRPLAEGPRGEELVRRYLAAFGPASVKDFQTWSGLTRASGWFAGLPTVKDEKGTILYDLPGATIADGDVPAPVVFLPEFDNAVLGHADRARVIRPGDRPRVMPGWSIVRPTVLVDGFVEATWSIKGGTVTVAPFRPLAARAEVEEAALRLAGFVAPEVAAAVEWV